MCQWKNHHLYNNAQLYVAISCLLLEKNIFSLFVFSISAEISPISYLHYYLHIRIIFNQFFSRAHFKRKFTENYFVYKNLHFRFHSRGIFFKACLMNQEGWSFANGQIMFCLLLKNKLVSLPKMDQLILRHHGMGQAATVHIWPCVKDAI